MLVEHTLQVVSKCPVNGCPDVYECVVRTDRVVLVEKILDAAKSLTFLPVTQEDFTQRLADAVGCEVETVGFHSGVKTRVLCSHSEVS